MRFIVFEGPDGAGKTTVISLIAEYIGKTQHPVTTLLTSEPQDRSILSKNPSPRECLEFFVDDRKRHCRALQSAREKLILCDRYALSTLVYQSRQGIPRDEIVDAHESRDLVVPDLQIVLWAEDAVLNARKASRSSDNSFDENIGSVAKTYADFVKDVKITCYGERVIFGDNRVLIDVTGKSPIEVAHECIMEMVGVQLKEALSIAR